MELQMKFAFKSKFNSGLTTPEENDVAVSFGWLVKKDGGYHFV
jgi:hypothetical protein